MGQFFFHTLPNATVHGAGHAPSAGVSGALGYPLLSVFVACGFYAMLLASRLGRVWHDNPYYVAASTGDESSDGVTRGGSVAPPIVHTLDGEAIELLPYHLANESDGDAFSRDTWTLQDERSELRRRRAISVVLWLVASVVGTLEGLYLVYHQHSALGGTWALVSAYAANKVLETVALITALLHALHHAAETRGAYAVPCALWCACATLSTLYVLLDMPWEAAAAALRHPALQIAYAACGGVLFWVALYFVWLESAARAPTVKATVARAALFGFAVALSWLTGFLV